MLDPWWEIQMCTLVGSSKRANNLWKIRAVAQKHESPIVWDSPVRVLRSDVDRRMLDIGKLLGSEWHRASLNCHVYVGLIDLYNHSEVFDSLWKLSSSNGRQQEEPKLARWPSQVCITTDFLFPVELSI